MTTGRINQVEPSPLTMRPRGEAPVRSKAPHHE